MQTQLNHHGDEHVAALRAMTAEIMRGVAGANLRAMLVPSQIIQIQHGLSTGDAEAVSFIMRDVVGEGLSLAAGGSALGGEAMQALSLAQAQCLVQLRLQQGPISENDFTAIAALMSAHRDSLIEWVRTGVVGTEVDHPSSCQPSDLTKIGQEFLTDPAVRKAAISVFVAGTAIIEAGLRLFISEKA